MRSFHGLSWAFAALCVLGASSTIGAGCSSDDSVAPGSDAGLSTDSGGDDGALDYDSALPPLPDGSTKKCTLSDTSDPVGLCVQKAALQAIHDSAFDPTTGVASRWSVDTGAPDVGDGGAILHDFHDDVAYASALAGYAQSAVVYGDTELEPVLSVDLDAVAKLLVKELPSTFAETDGALYFRLRRLAIALSLRSYTDDAAAINAAADAYALQLSAFFRDVTPSDADAGDDAGNGGEGGAPEPWGVLSTNDVAPFGYDAGDQLTGALALMDMAVRAGTVGDAGADASAPPTAASLALQRSAKALFDHAYARARHTSGLYYCDLMASTDPEHDLLAPWLPEPDILEAEEQAEASWALARAVDLVTKNPSLVVFAGYPFEARAEELLTDLNGAPNFWDTANGGFYVSYVPTSSTLDTGKRPSDSAELLASLHRMFVANQPQVAKDEINPLRALLLQHGQAAPGFLTILGQPAFIDEVSATFGFADPDAGVVAPRSYSAQATATVCEALNNLWFGTPHAPTTFQ